MRLSCEAGDLGFPSQGLPGQKDGMIEVAFVYHLNHIPAGRVNSRSIKMARSYVEGVADSLEIGEITASMGRSNHMVIILQSPGSVAWGLICHNEKEEVRETLILNDPG